MPLGALILACLATLLAAGLAALAMRTAFRRGWRRWVQVLAALAGAAVSFGVVLIGGTGLFDLLYPFVPKEVPEDPGLFGIIIVLGNVGGELRALDWAVKSAYAAAAAWVLVAGLTFWQNWRAQVKELSCSIPDDHIDPRRSALFMARSILNEVRDGRSAC